MKPLKTDNGWIKSSDLKPEYNVGVHVFIPEEDNHVTLGMWDISKKWVLLDEYRVPKSQVTYWRPIEYELPVDQSYEKCRSSEDDDKMSTEIRRLNIENFKLGKEVEKLQAFKDSLKKKIEERTLEILAIRTPFVLSEKDAKEVHFQRLDECKRFLELLDEVEPNTHR